MSLEGRFGKKLELKSKVD